MTSKQSYALTLLEVAQGHLIRRYEAQKSEGLIADINKYPSMLDILEAASQLHKWVEGISEEQSTAHLVANEARPSRVSNR